MMMLPERSWRCVDDLQLAAAQQESIFVVVIIIINFFFVFFFLCYMCAHERPSLIFYGTPVVNGVSTA